MESTYNPASRGKALVLNWTSCLQTFLPPIDFGPPALDHESLCSRPETNCCVSAADSLQFDDTFSTPISPTSDDLLLYQPFGAPLESQDAIEWNLDPIFLAQTQPPDVPVRRQRRTHATPPAEERGLGSRSSDRGPQEKADKTTAAATTTTKPAAARSRSQPSSCSSPSDDLRCWEHGCNGRAFTTSSNLNRHRRERSSGRAFHLCPLCGAYFSRTTARNEHIQKRSCTTIRRYSNGRQRPSKIGRRSSAANDCAIYDG